MITEYEVIRADHLDCGLVKLVVLKTLVPPVVYLDNPYTKYSTNWYIFRSKCISARKITNRHITLKVPENIAKRIIEVRAVSINSSIGGKHV